ncbi:MAG: hypothetical protein KGV44_10905 [Flavobacteriaceae bacterium]|nr:hypothetical protein [Flavobacteriaceae bacterium]
MKKQNIISDIALTVLLLYGVTTQTMTLYFWHEYAQGHSFFSTLFLGFIVAELKGLLWIFFIW